MYYKYTTLTNLDEGLFLGLKQWEVWSEELEKFLEMGCWKSW